MKDKLTELANNYKNNNIDACVNILSSIVESYNYKLNEDGCYNHDLKKLLFKTNFIHNPLGMRYQIEDYKKTKEILSQLLLKLNHQEYKVDKKLICDIEDLVIYTDVFYQAGRDNTKSIETSEFSKITFMEQLLCLILFYQDQIRLLMNEQKNIISKKHVTGLEMIISDRPVEHFENQKSSISDSMEMTLEGINELIHYLYYKHKEDISDNISLQDINLEMIKPYGNVDFERQLYIADQRHLLKNAEECFRNGYFGIGCVGNIDNQIVCSFAIENKEEYRARFVGLLRREYQLQSTSLMDKKANDLASNAQNEIEALSNKLIDLQKDDFIMFNFDEFHPNVENFNAASCICETKMDLIRIFTNDFYINSFVNEVKISDYIFAYQYLTTLAEIFYCASSKYIDNKNQATLLKEICIIDLDYLCEEFSRLYKFDNEYSVKIIDRFVFHESNNRYDDVFANTLIKISKSQVIFCPALINQMNMDRSIERQFSQYEISNSEIGHLFEKKFSDTLKKGYQKGFRSNKYKKIPNLKINTNKVKYSAFDGKDIEFDFVATFDDYLLLVELKAMMCSYDISDLVKRKKHIKEAVKQLNRRAESVINDWDIFKEKVSIKLPNKPFDKKKIILVACSDAYDFTPLKIGDVYVTDDSSFLKYFTHPIVSIMEMRPDGASLRIVDELWENKQPEPNEFKEYLLNPNTSNLFYNEISIENVPIPRINAGELCISFNEFKLKEDPIKNKVEMSNMNMII